MADLNETEFQFKNRNSKLYKHSAEPTGIGGKASGFRVRQTFLFRPASDKSCDQVSGCQPAVP